MGAGASTSLKNTPADARNDILQAGSAACEQIMTLVKVQAYSYSRKSWFDATIESISEEGALVRYDVGDDQRSKEVPFAELSECLRPVTESTLELSQFLAELANELIKWYVAAVLDDLFQTSEFSGKIACKQIMRIMKVQVLSSEGSWVEAQIDTLSETGAVVAYDSGGNSISMEIPLDAISTQLQPTTESTPELVGVLAKLPNYTTRRSTAAILDRLFRNAEYSASVEAHRASSVSLGSQVRLSAAGCAVQEGYRWEDDALAPGDVGELIKLDRFDPSWMQIRGPNGKQDWYQDGAIESV